MYEQFFGLNRPPFKITPDTSLFYDGGRRGDVLGALVYAVQRGEGIVKVVGEVGSGKTMLCRMLQQELPESVEIIYIANPSVSPDDILFVIAHELQLDVKKDSSKHEVMHLLQAHLLSRFSGNRQVVLFVEEAQGMPLETLEEIRLLSNLETDQDKLLQIILFGQPELDENLKTTSIRQLKERITHEFNLSPLSDKEIHTYLNFRMREVGYTGPELISEKVAKVIGKYSGGLLRRINIIADKVLLSAFADDTHDVSVKHVNAAVQDSGFERSIDGQLSNNNKMVYIVIALLALMTLFFFNANQVKELWRQVSHQSNVTKIETNEVASKESVGTIADEKKSGVTMAKSVVMPQDDKLEPELSDVARPTIVSKSEVVPEENKKAEQEQLASSVMKKEQNNAEELVEDRLTAIIVRKKKNSVDESQLKVEEINKNVKKDQNIISKVLESTKIDNNITDYNNKDWLAWKINQSKQWLERQPDKGVSIQVMMRSKSASNELANVLRYQWALDVEKTYLYEVKIKDSYIYRIFYGGYSSLALGQEEIKNLPESVRSNDPYLHSIYKMKKTLL